MIGISLQAYSAVLFDALGKTQTLSYSAINIGTAGTNMLLSGIDLLQPIVNVNIKYSVQSAQQLVGASYGRARIGAH